MKIAVVAQHASLQRPRSGSSPRPDDAVLHELATALSRQGHRVTVYASYPHGTKSPGTTELSPGLRVEFLPVASSSDVLAQVPAFSAPLRERLLRHRPDVVHAVSWVSGLAALSATRGLGIPVVQAFSTLGVAENRNHGPADGHGKPSGKDAPSPAGMRLRLEPAIGRSADAVVAASSEVVSDLTRMGVPRNTVRCVPWGVDTDTFTPEGPVAARNGRPRLLTPADLTEREELQTLLRALTKVPDAELMVVGGPARDQLRGDAAYRSLAAMTGSLGLSDRVMFTGRINRREMPALLRSADLVVSTCAYEPSGVTSLEAMACGKPVVAPPTGGHVDAVVDGTTGILIPPGRPALLAQRIRQLLAHPLLMEAYGVAAVDRARSRYSWDRIAAETLAVYDRAVSAAA
ncbi:MAG TPA: glycosyltransferase [Streptosporangiaceae bacterium]|nr:glycosyltransferase [Streptosporangiaceae bacterium]